MGTSVPAMVMMSPCSGGVNIVLSMTMTMLMLAPTKPPPQLQQLPLSSLFAVPRMPAENTMSSVQSGSRPLSPSKHFGVGIASGAPSSATALRPSSRPLCALFSVSALSGQLVTAVK